MNKTIIGIIVVAVIAGGVWYWMNRSSVNTNPEPATNTVSSVDTNQTAAVANVKPSLTTNANDSSDTAIDTDLKTVDAEFGGLSADSTTAGNTIIQSATE